MKIMCACCFVSALSFTNRAFDFYDATAAVAAAIDDYQIDSKHMWMRSHHSEMYNFDGSRLSPNNSRQKITQKDLKILSQESDFIMLTNHIVQI